MSGSAYQWRAEGGYQQMPSQQQAPRGMIMIPGPPPGLQLGQPQFLVPAPVGVYKIATQQAQSRPRQHAAIPPPPPSNARDEEKKKEKEKKEEKPKSKSNPYAPPPLDHGQNYMYAHPEAHTVVNIFRRSDKCWGPKYSGQQPTRGRDFKDWKVPTERSVKAMIEIVLRAAPSEGGEKCKGWAVTEVIERGNSEWHKGSTIEYTSDKAKGTLAAMGWSSRRGGAEPPVWLCVHKVGEKK